MLIGRRCWISPCEHGVELRLGLVDEDDAAYEVEAVSELGFGDEDLSGEERYDK
jgi:hypothetical protein